MPSLHSLLALKKMSGSASSRVSDSSLDPVSSGVSGPFLLGLHRTSNDRQNEIIDATMDCIRAHVGLIILGTLSVERSRLVLADAILALPKIYSGFLGVCYAVWRGSWRGGPRRCL